MLDKACNPAFFINITPGLVTFYTIGSAQVGLMVKVCHFIVEEVMIGLVNTAWPGH